MADVHAYRDLAAHLATSFTVLSVERRGRRLSPRPYRRDHDLARDVEDLDAVLGAEGAQMVFGLSSGAVIALEATRQLARVAVAALYEPPFYPKGIDHVGIARMNEEIETGDYPSALLDALLNARTAPAVFARLPRRAGRFLTRAALAVDERLRDDGSSLRSLLPSVRYDFHDVAQVDGRMNDYAHVDKPIVLLSGTTSPTFLRDAARALDGLLPNSTHIELEGPGHDGPWNSGRPGQVADALLRYLGGQA